MKIASINTVSYGSTGKIMLQIAQTAREKGHIVKTFSKTWKSNPYINDSHIYIGTYVGNVAHRILAPFTAREGSYSFFSTRKLINELHSYRPDVLHLHNLHGWYLNYKILFRYIKQNNIRVIWTLHDCWAFTGQCPHFTVAQCDKWKTGCYHCSQYRAYPETYVDRTRQMWKLKKEWFTGVPNMTIVTPSQWLADLVKESFLKEYPVKVIHNGIDLDIFKPTPSNFRMKYHCENKFVLLGVAFGWGKRKGLDVFIDLAKRLGSRFQIVLVGTDEKVDQQLPENIISIHRTSNQKELAEIYTSADLFVNPTREENYPTVNMEAIACGTPVLTFRTGGSPEIVDELTGCVVDCDDVDAVEQKIILICENKSYSAEKCVVRALEFDKNERFEEYIKLYESN